MLIWRFIKIVGNYLIPILAPVPWVFVIFQKLIKEILFSNKDGNKKILLIAQNKIAADHIKLIWDLFKNDSKLIFFVTDDQLFSKHFSKKDLSAIINVKYINILHALLCYWDLIIYVNHPWGFGIWFAPFIKKVFINHGICTGKINNMMGEDGVYGKSRVIRPYSKPFYDKMFAASSFEKEHAISSTKELLYRVAVTGFLRADLVEKLQKKQRDFIRKKLGYTKEDIIIHIISTWGQTSLFQTIGENLLYEAIKISDKYKFIFSLHPRHDEFGDIKGRKRKDILNKYQSQGIRPASELAWDEYVVASDIAISDQSSLCLYHVLLNKPVILVPVNSESYVKNSVFYQLKNLTHILECPNKLDNIIQIAINESNKKEIYELSLAIRSYPGCAAERYKEEIYRLLFI
ncbi:CDP-glycerol glycerophosphotransferase family protein [Desulfocicer niacini]